MTFEEALKTYVGSVSAVTALIGTRFYPVKAPEAAAAPYAVYRCTGDSTEATDTIGGPGDLHEWPGEIECYGKTYADAKAVDKALRVALNGWDATAGLMGGAVEVDCIWAGKASDLPFDFDGQRTYGVHRPYRAWYRE